MTLKSIEEEYKQKFRNSQFIQHRAIMEFWRQKIKEALEELKVTEINPKAFYGKTKLGIAKGVTNELNNKINEILN
jgi:hypothetical protein